MLSEIRQSSEPSPTTETEFPPLIQVSWYTINLFAHAVQPFGVELYQPCTYNYRRTFKTLCIVVRQPIA
jgi:hypothetical protein